MKNETLTRKGNVTDWKAVLDISRSLTDWFTDHTPYNRTRKFYDRLNKR